ncbi:MAG TPA: hypothetical protein VJH97_00175 [Candidatus Nanoarchaeia archaeon]|nr:hypothetical protein [Candidatus Nanoarchaeia archaeon]
MMKIVVCGSGTGSAPEILEAAKSLGKEIAQHHYTLLTGGCKGYPYAAARGALLAHGHVVAYSPAKDEEEHSSKYGFPLDEGVEFIFTGLGIPDRNLPLINAADVVVILDGQIGTLNEFTIAFHKKKRIAIYEKGKLAPHLNALIEICNKAGERSNVSFFSKDLLKSLK